MSSAISNDIEQIVRLVVQRLRADTLVVPSSQERTTNDGMALGVGQTKTCDGVLHLTSGVISLSEVQDRLSGIHTVQIGKKALVTPAVSDELRRRNVRLARVGERPTNNPRLRVQAAEADSPSAHSFQLIASSDKLKTIIAVVKGIPVRARSTDLTTVELVQQILHDWQQDTRAVWCSLEPYAAAMACMTGGQQRLRAIGLHHPAELIQAVGQCHPNVLVVDDRRWSGYQVARLIQSWSSLDGRFSGRSK